MTGDGPVEPVSVFGATGSTTEAEDLDPNGVPSRSAPRRPRRPRRGWRVVVVLALLALPFVVAIGWFWYQVSPPGDPGRTVTVVVPRGVGVSGIADRLEVRSVIGSSLAFRIYSRLTGSSSFQAGTYRMREDLGAREAIKVLERGPRQHYEKLALPPGLTLAEITARVGALPGRSAVAFQAALDGGTVRSKFQPVTTQSLEGLTWPDTYLVEDHETELDILATMVRSFDRHGDEIGLATAPDPYRVVIIASLIQREAGVARDRPLISAVIANRLTDGMMLQIDATVLYARGGGTQPLTNADFARDSPYNTYRVTGLPPTPISTVTDAMLRAARQPADAPFKYYVLTDASGRHAFAVTLPEHEANIADARRRGVLK